MELARPRIPEKPPVAAKPRARPAPPRPPKPSSHVSVSMLSPPCPSALPAQNDQVISHKNKSHIRNCNSSLPSITTVSQPSLLNPTRTNSAEALAISKNESRRSQEELSPPSSGQPKSPLSPSTSFSLPASFRNIFKNKTDSHAALTLTIPFTPTSPSSPPCLSPKSPIRHVSPPRRAPPVISPKPKPVTASSTNSDHNTQERKEKNERPNSDTHMQHKAPRKSVQAVHSNENQNNCRSHISGARAHKHANSVTPPQRPTSPPSRPVPCPGRPPDRPGKLSPNLTNPAVPTRTNQSSHLQANDEDVNKADVNFPSGKKSNTPPPLPKNPPRGGFPRKPRSSSIRATSETTPPLGDGEQNPDSTLNAHDGYSDGSDKVNSIGDVLQLQLTEADGETELLSGDAKLVLCDTASLEGSAEGTCSYQNNCNACLHSVDNSSLCSHVCDPKTRTPPKPRPRTRSSLPPSSDEGEESAKSSVKPTQSDGNENSASLISDSSNIVHDSHQESKAIELEYAEVYQNPSEDNSSETKSLHCYSEHNISQNLDHSNNICQSGRQITEEASAILRNPPSNHSESCFISVESTFENEPSRHSIISFDSQKLFTEEPETTCDMLKEIEELLKNKLGDIDIDLDGKSHENSQINSHPTEENPLTDKETDGENNFCNQGLENSLSSSPVRPPRPKRQATISKHLGSQESLNASVGSSSIECLANLDQSLTNGQNTGSGKKLIPPKPKRTFQSRVSRSHSDVTGMKTVADSSPTSEDAPQLQQEDVKPFLPPRFESLRRSDSSNSCSYQSPPPLPPRNKPRSISLKENCGSDQEFPTLATRGSLSDLCPTSRAEPEMAENAQASPSVSQTGVQSDLQRSKTTSGTRPRPSRKAPPPPPGAPKRSATFTPGDKNKTSEDQRNEQIDIDEIPQTSSPLVNKPIRTKENDSCYHEISDGVSIPRDESSQEREETPPALPPRASKVNSESKHGSVIVEIPQGNSVDAKDCKAESSSEKSDVPKPATLKTHSSFKEQRHMEKMAKSALIQKVAQGLGFGKSSRKSKVPDISLVTDRTSKVAVGDFGKEAAVKIESAAISDTATGTSSDHVNSAAHNFEEFSLEATPAEGSGSSATSLERPLSEISQRSSGSEQEGGTQAFGLENMDEIVSSGTDTEPEEDKEEIYAQRKAKKVFFIAKEIVSSESTFVDVLQLLNVDFRVHISKSTEKLGHPVVPTETLNKILDFLPQLQNFNEDLLKDLQERIDKWEENPRLADIFVKKGPFLKLYSSYIRNFENATAVLEDATKKNPTFAAALKEFEMTARCAKLALKHYMLKPIQRIPQYRLLLQDYLKHLTEGSSDYKDTVTALNIVSEVADHANDSMRHGDNVQKLLEIQRSLIGQFEVIQPSRILLKQGELLKLSRKEMQPRMFFLFNDVLLYTTSTTSGYKINNILPLTGMKINSTKLEDYKYEFNIISVQRSFTLSASSSEAKEQWVLALQTAIEETAKKHHTFQSVRQGPQTSLLDKDFVLGHKAPLWVPDARVTMCMLCLVEFTLTWRRHHCRSCGRVVCSHCSENKAPLRYLKYEPARVCDNCFDKLRADMTYEYHQQGKKAKPNLSVSEEDSTTSLSENAAEDVADISIGEDGNADAQGHDSGLSLNNLMARFQKIRISNRDKRKPSRPSVLKEVHANDEGSDMSGYLRMYRSRKWKRLWFVVKGKVLYTYKASEDMAATESMPLLGYEVARLNAWFEGAEPDLLFELTHQNNQLLTTRKEGDRVCPRVVLGTEKTTQRLIFRTDSATATTKWISVLREASLTFQ